MAGTVRSMSAPRQAGEAAAGAGPQGSARKSRPAWRIGHRLAVLALGLCILPLLLIGALALRLCFGAIDVTDPARRITASAASGPGPLHGLALQHVRLAWRDREVGILVDGIALASGSHADHVELALRPWPLLRRHVVLLQATVTGATLLLWRDRDGRIGLSRAQPGGAPDRTAIDLHALRTLRVRQSDVMLTDEASGTGCRAAIDDLALTPLRRPAATGAAGRLEASLSCGTSAAPGPTLRVHGSGREAPDGGIAWRVRTDPVVPAALASPALVGAFPVLGELGNVRLPVALALDSTLSGGFGAYMIPRAVHLTATLGAGTVLLPDKAQSDTVPIASGRLVLDVALPDDPSGPLRAGLSPSQLQLAGPDAPDLTLSGRGTLHGSSMRFGLVVDAPLLSFAGLQAYWPHAVAGGAQGWVTANITAGTARRFHLDLGMASEAGPDALRLDRLRGGVEAEGMVVHWLRPVPPLHDLDGRLVFDGIDALHIVTQHGIEDVPGSGARNGGAIALGAASMRITGLSAPRQDAQIEASLSGGVADLMVLLANPRLRLLSRHPVPFTAPSGHFTGHLRLALPLLENVSADALKVQADARLTSLHLGDVAVGRDLDQADVTLTATQEGLSAQGDGLIGGMPSGMSYGTDFRAGPPGQHTETAHVTSHVSDAAMQQEGLDDAHRFSGEALLDVRYVHDRSGAARIALSLDLTQAGLETPLWRKQPGTPATASGVFGLQDQHLVSIESLHADGDQLALDGRAEVQQGHARTIVIDRFRLGRSRGSGRIVLPSPPGQPVTPLRLSLHGPVLDVLPYLSQAAPAREPAAVRDGKGAVTAAPARAPVPDAAWQADLAFRKVLFSPTRGFDSVTLHAEAHGSVVSAARLRVAGPTPVAATLSPGQGGRSDMRRLRVHADDTGALLRAIGVVDTVEGGVLQLDGALGSAGEGLRLRATASIGPFTVHDAPLAARMARDLSVYGFLLGAPSRQLVVTRFEAPFVLTGDTLLLTDAHASNDALGATLRGPVHLARETLDLKGTIVPSYLFNALPGRLPGVGAVFSPEKGGGLLAATLTIKGPIDHPLLRVNPLALLAPGILRRLLFN